MKLKPEPIDTRHVLTLDGKGSAYLNQRIDLAYELIGEAFNRISLVHGKRIDFNQEIKERQRQINFSMARITEARSFLDAAAKALTDCANIELPMGL